MIITKVLQQFPFFASLKEEQLTFLVQYAREEWVEAGHFIFEIGKELDHFYLILEGSIEIIFDLPKVSVDIDTFRHPTHLHNEFVTIGTIGPGDIFGWSGLVPPYIATSSVRTITFCKIITFDSKKLLKVFEDDCNLGFLMIQAAAQAIGKRLQAIYHLQDSL